LSVRTFSSFGDWSACAGYDGFSRIGSGQAVASIEEPVTWPANFFQTFFPLVSIGTFLGRRVGEEAKKPFFSKDERTEK
jgi:hypothetical protein